MHGPENERLPLQEFNLDVELKDRHLFNNSVLCTNMRAYYGSLIIEQDKVTDYLKKHFWDTMSTPGKSIWAIWGNYEVRNYVLLPHDQRAAEARQCVEERRAVEALMSCEDSFEPWYPQRRRS